MSLFGRKWPAPIAQPMMPFYAAGAIILYGVNSFANTLYNTDEHRNDPRNPLAKAQATQAH
ncbi:putative mitochondrial F1F0 ATP synthase subunit Atp18 [Trichodelitschia bisporula]|uniref:Putative mitochondrial F1F0 ATP synthase subunit Atp18 n=1 Tax=Trichodelitschia bisporula TaxID=703511 RepID=A0A6G1HNC5_9PEZI|nr:putative mitochondrial F1F0 ATP synthase subunit Atp18 [Trichodelitschia bisporula]